MYGPDVDPTPPRSRPLPTSQPGDWSTNPSSRDQATFPPPIGADPSILSRRSGQDLSVDLCLSSELGISNPLSLVFLGRRYSDLKTKVS